jgi:gliding motility-associated-like protein
MEDLTFYVDILQTNLFIPNSFTPNGDNVNDLFEIFSPNHEILNLGIYNRWGDKVFSDLGPNFKWNGQIGNTKAEPGVYIYEVLLRAANGRTRQETGSLTLIR